MNLISLVIQREYLTRVRKKSFLLTTLLVPIAIMAFYAAIAAISVSSSSETRLIGIVDEAGLFPSDSIRQDNGFQYVILKDVGEKDIRSSLTKNGYEAIIHLMPFNADTPGKFRVYSEASLDISGLSSIEDIIGDGITRIKLKKLGLSQQTYQSLNPEISIENITTGDKINNTETASVSAAISFIGGFLIYLLLMIYGTQVMRGVMEEKSSRISEVMISSVKPFNLMMGKILGIGAVGLTQFLIWLLLMIGMKFSIPFLFDYPIGPMAAGGPENQGALLGEIMPTLDSLPMFKIITCFIFYFLGGYLTYSALFAAIGSMVGEDQQDTQQLVFPVIMPIIVGFVIMSKAIETPNSSLAIFGSYFPLTSPIVMMGRITTEVPWWELAISMGLLAACFIFFTWLSGKIYRVGILMYGKKPSWKEALKWVFRKH